jgi:Sulfotransferase domain
MRNVPVHLIHCSYHKCLTVYFRRIMDAVFNRCLPWTGGYRHYNSHLQDFYSDFERRRVASINNRALDLSRLGRFRLSRFVRDPRDLVVSGYFYHRRGAEPWLWTESPTQEDWYFANGCVPQGLSASGTSYARYLQSVSEEEGLLAEIEFRRFHFESMAAWPEEHPEVAIYRYEEVIRDEVAALGHLFAFYGLPRLERWLATRFASRYAVAGRRADPHVRNPEVGQWRTHFTPKVKRKFDARYGDLVARLGYPAR